MFTITILLSDTFTLVDLFVSLMNINKHEQEVPTEENTYSFLFSREDVALNKINKIKN